MDNCKLKENKENTNLYFLNEELEQLKKSISKSRINGDVGTYKNLIKAYRDVLTLINEEEQKNKFEQKYSVYENLTDNKKQIAVWEQNNYEIRNHRIFNIENEVKKIEDMKLKDIINSENIDKLVEGYDKDIQKLLKELSFSMDKRNSFVEKQGTFDDIIKDIDKKVENNMGKTFIVVLKNSTYIYKNILNSEYIKYNYTNVKVENVLKTNNKIECGDYRILFKTANENDFRGCRADYIYLYDIDYSDIDNMFVSVLKAVFPKRIYKYTNKEDLY